MHELEVAGKGDRCGRRPRSNRVLADKGGTQVVTQWNGQPMFSFGLIAACLVLIASAAIPERLMSKLTTLKKKKRN